MEVGQRERGLAVVGMPLGRLRKQARGAVEFLRPEQFSPVVAPPVGLVVVVPDGIEMSGEFAEESTLDYAPHEFDATTDSGIRRPTLLIRRDQQTGPAECGTVLQKLGVVPIPLDYLPLPEIDISRVSDRPYWNYERKMLAAAKLIADKGLDAAIARERNLWVISDEAYEDVIYNGEHVSIASLPGMYDRTIPIYTMSKSYAITGVRVGYFAIKDKALRSRAIKLVLYTTSNVSSIAQYGAIGALGVFAVLAMWWVV